MRLAAAVIVMSAILGASGAPAAENPAFVIVVAPSNPVTSIKRQELARLFLRKTSRWSDGREVAPVDQSVGSLVRSAFTRAVLSVEGMGQLSSVQAFWLQQVYSGRSAPPPVKPADSDIIAFVGANPGAVGYVSAVPTGAVVKVLTIMD